jgi:hypothetical protein
MDRDTYFEMQSWLKGFAPKIEAVIYPHKIQVDLRIYFDGTLLTATVDKATWQDHDALRAKIRETVNKFFKFYAENPHPGGPNWDKNPQE